MIPKNLEEEFKIIEIELNQLEKIQNVNTNLKYYILVKFQKLLVFDILTP